MRDGGGFWIASEGNADSRRNMLAAVAADGTVEAEVPLPEEVEAQAVRFGFEGVASWQEDGTERVVVAVQREWEGDPAGHVRLAVYDTGDESWGFVHYPIDAPSSPNGGWVGLSEIIHLGEGRFAVLERDNQPGAYSTHKVVTVISLAGVTPAPAGETPPVVEKTVVIDLLPILRATSGWISDKPEGLTVAADGTLWLVVDNDGVDDSTGETQLLDLGPVDALVN